MNKKGLAILMRTRMRPNDPPKLSLSLLTVSKVKIPNSPRNSCTVFGLSL